MKVVAAILAGGLGTRLRPVLGEAPKALAPVGETPFVSYLLDQVAEANISRVVVCAGHLAQQFEQRLEPSIVVMREEWPMGTAGALRKAVEQLDGDAVLVLNGDSYVDTRLGSFQEWHKARGWQSSLIVTRVENAAGLGTIDVDPQGQILKFHPGAKTHGPGWINAGVSLLARSWLEALPSDTPLSLEGDVYPYWLSRGMGGYCVDAPFIDIGTPEAMARAPAFFASIKRRPVGSAAAGSIGPDAQTTRPDRTRERQRSFPAGHQSAREIRS